MLCGLAWLDVATPPTERLDRLRFAGAVAMTVFATGLAYSFVRTFDAYEAALRERGAVLKRLRDMRHAIALAIYEELGLQLTREHLQRMGGQLKLENRPEGGLDAVVILPVALVATSPDADA
jgi:hypothetical protein